MKQHKSTRISIVLFLFWMPLIFSSCEKIIPFDPSSSQPVLVLNAVPSAEKQLFVYFSYSHLFLDTSNYCIRTITMEENLDAQSEGSPEDPIVEP